MNALETQEAGTGKWFPVITYTPGTVAQMEDAHSRASSLRSLGLLAVVTGFQDARKDES